MTFDIGHNGNPKKNIFFLNVYRITRFFEKLNKKKILAHIYKRKYLEKFDPFSSVGFVYEFSNCFWLNMTFDIGHNGNPISFFLMLIELHVFSWEIKFKKRKYIFLRN